MKKPSFRTVFITLVALAAVAVAWEAVFIIQIDRAIGRLPTSPADRLTPSAYPLIAVARTRAIDVGYAIYFVPDTNQNVLRRIPGSTSFSFEPAGGKIAPGLVGPPRAPGISILPPEPSDYAKLNAVVGRMLPVPGIPRPANAFEFELAALATQPVTLGTFFEFGKAKSEALAALIRLKQYYFRQATSVGAGHVGRIGFFVLQVRGASSTTLQVFDLDHGTKQVFLIEDSPENTRSIVSSVVQNYHLDPAILGDEAIARRVDRAFPESAPDAGTR